RQKPEIREIPVIAVTAHALVAEQERILLAGCRACLAKPIDFQGLREQLNYWLRTRTVSRTNSYLPNRSHAGIKGRTQKGNLPARVRVVDDDYRACERDR